jgi:hypothetical protein
MALRNPRCRQEYVWIQFFNGRRLVHQKQQRCWKAGDQLTWEGGEELPEEYDYHSQVTVLRIVSN